MVAGSSPVTPSNVQHGSRVFTGSGLLLNSSSHPNRSSTDKLEPGNPIMQVPPVPAAWDARRGAVLLGVERNQGMVLMDKGQVPVLEKARYITEIRHSPLPRVIDTRGEVIERFHPSIKTTFPHWKVDHGSVLFVDELEAPSREVLFSLNRFSYIFEDVPYSEYRASTRRLIEQLFEFGQDVDVLRIGARQISVYGIPGVDSYEQVFERVFGAFTRDVPEIGLNYNDIRLTLEHDAGRIEIGPVKAGETWLETVYSRPTEFIPDVGIGVDIDSSAKDFGVGTLTSLVDNLTAVWSITKRVETAVLASLGAFDVEATRR